METAAMKIQAETIIIEQTYLVPIERVWKAITTLDEMQEWFFEQLEKFEAAVGFETKFTIYIEKQKFPHVWKIIDVQPPGKMIYDWSYEGYPGKSIVRFELFKKENATQLRLTDQVIEPYPNSIPGFKRERGLQAWNFFIKKSLKTYLQKQKLNDSGL